MHSISSSLLSIPHSPFTKFTHASNTNAQWLSHKPAVNNSSVHNWESKPSPMQVYFKTDYFHWCGQIKT